ncbi:aminotransferase class I/II-fold pyridoxal phosphate-dependent enzyme [Streptomyces sp. NPDC020681]|uniref:aminotransferase class I/II-fold pyridoxal phosphate-dependent enzyme n=1 Tax=Streptomyces sp. NPDC020681 TaxID=3365083 RepID=UPI0037A48ECF
MLHLPAPALPRDPASVQGGDLTQFPPGQIVTDLSICANRYGPPPSALDAVRALVDERPGDLVPPPYGAEERYLQAFAEHLGVQAADLLPGRGVSEFIAVLSRILRRTGTVAVVSPDYTETMQRFSYATFYGPANAARDTVEARLSRVHEAMWRHPVVWLSNPSNPLGHFIPPEALLEVALQRPESLLVVDEEYVEFQGQGLSLAGADADNLVILTSSGKAWGLVGTRAGILWTRNERLRERVRAELISWPLGLLDTHAASAALNDEHWLRRVRPVIQHDARLLHEALVERFDELVSDADIHFRFVHLLDPHPVAAHLADHGIAVRLFDGSGHSASGIRVTAPTGPTELAQLRAALDSLPAGWGLS